MRVRGWLIVVAAVAWSSPGLGQQAPTTTLNQITRIDTSDGSVRISCTQKPNFTTLNLSAPPRLVIDFSDTVLAEKPHEVAVHQGALGNVRTETFRSDTSSVSRVVIGLVGEADTDIEALPDNSLHVKVTAVQAGPTVAHTATQPKVEVVSSAELEARAAAQAKSASEAESQAKAATQAKAEAESQTKAANEAKAKSDANAQAEAKARVDAEAKAEQETKARQAAEAKAQAAEKRLAELEAQSQADAKARQAAEAKADQEAKGRAAAEAKAKQESQARAAAEASEAQRAKEVQAAAERAAEQQRQADAAQAKQQVADARAKQQAAEAQAKQAAEEARQAEIDRKKQQADANEQARLAEVAHRKDLAAAELAHQKELAAEEAQQAERDRVAQLQKKQQSQAQAREENEARKRADAEARAEAKREKEQQEAESKAKVAAATPPPVHEAAQVRVASAVESDVPVVRGGTKDISLVGFRQTTGGSRVFVRANDAVKYSLTQSGANRVVLEVENARISQRNGTRPLDTSFFDGPVTLIAPSEDRHAHTVRVVIDLREMVPYQTRLEGNDVVIDFQG